MLDPVIRDLAHGKNFGSISFHLPSGAIATHVMWVDADDDHVLVNTEIHRAKYKAIEADPNVTVAIWSAEDTYAYAEVRGTVAGEVRGPAARAHIDALAQKYTGGDFQGEIQSERVILQITPIRQRTMGF
ncbi:MAG: pyridoxamine 5'-phosphate oxidase family protein [Actinomycetota bacterium]|nr:pyridoxamine 5'-phosphate oxidase family protein [Actinomycetota bacterium]